MMDTAALLYCADRAYGCLSPVHSRVCMNVCVCVRACVCVCEIGGVGAGGGDGEAS